MITYKDIPGWFDYQAIYDQAVEVAKPDAIFVEIGCWLGKSTAYLARKIRESGKLIQLDVVDTFAGSPTEPDLMIAVKNHGGSIRQAFEWNMKACGVWDEIDAIWDTDSATAAKEFANGAVDFAFIDADHRYANVCQDIKAWFPKVKKGGVLAGHDYNLESVQLAVRDTLGRVERIGNSWRKVQTGA